MDRRAWILTGLAALVAVALGVWLASLRSAEGPRPAGDPEGEAVPAGGGERAPRPAPAGGGESPTPPPPTTPGETGAITGVVIDSFARSGIAGAHVEAHATDPERDATPRPPEDDAPSPPDRVFVGSGAEAVSAKDGTFRLEWTQRYQAQITVRAAGYGRTEVEGVQAGRRVEIVLSRGGSIAGHAVGPDDKPVPGVWVRARGEGKATPEAWGSSDENGAFEIGDLVSGRYALRLRAPGRMESGSVVDVPGAGDVRVVLAPALVVWLSLRASGDALPARAKVTAEADGAEVASRVVNPAVTHPTGRPGERPGAGPLRVPATANDVVVTVSAAGFTPWTSGRVRIPPGGADEILEPVLERDPAFGGIRLEISDAGTGATLAASDAVVRWMRADGAALPPEVSAAADARFRIEGLPPGAYRLAVAYPGREPTEATATVAGGAVADVRAALAEGARLLVRVKVPQWQRVRARLTKDGQPVVVWPEDAVGRRPAGDAPETGVFFAGAKGVVLTGLGTGPYAVEVVDPRWSASPAEARPSRSRLLEVELLATPR